MIIRFRSGAEHEELLKKVKKMKKFASEIEECLEDASEESMDFRGGSYRKEYDDDEDRIEGRYGYRRGMR